MSSFDLIKEEYSNFGGNRAIVKSKFLFISVLLTTFSFPYWSQRDLYDISISIFPNIIGFTLAAIAIILGIADTKFAELLGKRIEKLDRRGPFFQILNTFFIVAIVQSITLLLSVFMKFFFSSESLEQATSIFGKDFTSYFYCLQFWARLLLSICIFYSLLLIIVTAIEIMRIARWFEYYINHKDDN